MSKHWCIKSYGKWSGSPEIEANGRLYKVAVDAQCVYEYLPGVMDWKEGDPGAPYKSELTVTSCAAKWYDGNLNEVKPTKEMTDCLYDYLYDLSYDEWGV